MNIGRIRRARAGEVPTHVMLEDINAGAAVVAQMSRQTVDNLRRGVNPPYGIFDDMTTIPDEVWQRFAKNIKSRKSFMPPLLMEHKHEHGQHTVEVSLVEMELTDLAPSEEDNFSLGEAIWLYIIGVLGLTFVLFAAFRCAEAIAWYYGS